MSRIIVSFPVSWTSSRLKPWNETGACWRILGVGVLVEPAPQLRRSLDVVAASGDDARGGCLDDHPSVEDVGKGRAAVLQNEAGVASGHLAGRDLHPCATTRADVAR